MQDNVLRYTLTLADYQVYCREQGSCTRMATYCFSGALILALLLILYGYGTGNDKLFEFSVLFLPAIVIAWIIFAWLYWPWSTKRYFEKQRGANSQIVIKVGDTGFEIQDAHMQATLDWGFVKSLSETEAHFILWQDDIIGITVPKRSFQHQEDIRKFADLVRDKIAPNGDKRE